MLQLLPLERHLFLGILILSIISSVLGHVQIVKGNVRFRRLLVAFASLQITLGAVLLILRAVAIKAFPITGVFESMLPQQEVRELCRAGTKRHQVIPARELTLCRRTAKLR